MLQHPLRHWLSLRIRFVCFGMLFIGSLLPPYIPREAQAEDGEEEAGEELPQFLLVEDGFLMKSSSLTQQGARRAYSAGIVHTVQDGESLERIAARYGIKPDTIRWANKLDASSVLKPKQELVILPVDGVLHAVTRGQTLSRIAQLYDISSQEIARQNDLQGGFILVGQNLIIPGGKPIVAAPTQIAAKPGSPAAKPSTRIGETGLAPGRKPPVSPGRPTVEAAVPTVGILQMPCNGCSFTQYYHAGHYAVDIQERGGGPIFAAEAGTVIRSETGWNGGYGNVIEIDHGNGLVTLYAHNKDLYVKEGDRVERGQQIAFMGNTGRVYGQTGIHIHFEVRSNGIKKNPMLYIK